MRPEDDPNLPRLRVIAEALGDLREQVVFLGGAVVGLLVSDPLAERVRATYDVDAVVDLEWSGFRRLEARVEAQGFMREMESGVVCRWVHRATGLIFDLMPVDPDVLGFSNRWYGYAVETAHAVRVSDHISIRLVTAVAFVATKLEAFATRGGGDFLASHDLEDVLNVVDGRDELAAEMAAAPSELRRTVSEVFARLVSNPAFVNALPGLITDSGRAGIVLRRLQAMVDQRP